MFLFLLLYCITYGSMHYYFLYVMKNAFPDVSWLPWVIVAFSVIMVSMPISVQLLDHDGHYMPARLLAIIGYTWGAWLFWFITVSAVVHSWNGITILLSYWRSGCARWAVSPRVLLVAIVCFVAFATAWGWVEASEPRLKTVEVPLGRTKLPEDGLRIVQISDLHLGLIVRAGYLEKVLELVRQARPDILVSTGDLVDSSFDFLDSEADMLAAVKPPMGKYAVPGNHEHYVGIRDAIRFHEAAGFRWLSDDATRAGEKNMIVGMGDPAGEYMGNSAPLGSEDKILPATAPSGPVILLKHRPRVADEAYGRFDLQLSGHVHGGQIFPYGFVVRIFYPFGTGLKKVTSNSYLYVSRGTGTWGPPMRLFTPPEVTLLILKNPA